MQAITVTAEMTGEEQRRALDQSLRAGFLSESASYPVTRIGQGRITALSLRPDWDDPSDSVSGTASDYAKAIPDMDWRPKKGLEALFTPGRYLLDQDFDQLPDEVNLRFRLPEVPSVYVLAAACDLAHRIGMETTGFSGSLWWDKSWEGPVLTFTGSGSCSMSLEESEDITVGGSGEELIAFISTLCNNFQRLPEGRTWTWQLQAMTDSLAGGDLDGQLAWLSAHWDQTNRCRVYTEPGFGEQVKQAEKYFSKAEFIDRKGKKLRWERSFDIPWEADRFLEELHTKVYPKITPGAKVEIRGRLSEDLAVRSALAQRIAKELEELGAGPTEVRILCSYKQGYSWLTEEILPQLEAVNAKSISVAFQPFLAPGIADWGDVDGAVPSYNTMGGASREHWLDLPIRWLQELYPADDTLAAALGIPKSAITFKQTDREGITYEVIARDEKDREVFHADYAASWSQRPYLDAFPQAGLVHPATGQLEALINGELLFKIPIPSDLESIWDVYQKEILPAVGETLMSGQEKLLASDQPFFAELELSMAVSEPDEELPSRQDLLSSLDAFHEDLYFVGSDYFRFLGAQKGETIDAPGLILPKLRKTAGKPEVHVALFDPIARESRIDIIKAAAASKENSKAPEESIEITVMKGRERREIQLCIKRLAMTDGVLSVTLATNLMDADLLKAYASLLEEGMLLAGRYLPAGEILLEGPGGTCKARLRQKEDSPSDLSLKSLAELDLSEGQVISYDRCQTILTELSRCPGLSVYPVARSYQGREVQAVEFIPQQAGYISRTKRLTRYPSLYINARHHANEVSSTNAAFLLIQRLLTDPEFKEIAHRLNLVIVPMENPDGTEIHFELQKTNPKWKLHVARFNAIGKEFYRDHFNPDTIHTEAMGLTRLWQRMLPDVMVDNHGVPSHEWEQQFSGYTSPAFKGFWIPRSLLYGYFWYVTDPEYSANQALNRSMENVIAKAMLADPQITARNLEWKEVFETYAHSWMPKLFPAEYYQNMINYWIPFSHDAQHRYPSIRFPWITSVAYTSEVADETAQGEYLSLCADAHVRHDLAVIRALITAALPMEREFSIAENTAVLKERRLRPLKINPKETISQDH